MPSKPIAGEGRQTWVNWITALDATGGDEQLLDELVTTCLQELPLLMADIGRAIDERELKLLRRSAHTVKGSLRIFESPLATDLAEQLEEMAKELADKTKQGEVDDATITTTLAAATQLLAKLEAVIPFVQAELRKRLDRQNRT
jgi:HPt (histidine-containing phosphotransfer) domain-containing protein